MLGGGLVIAIAAALEFGEILTCGLLVVTITRTGLCVAIDDELTEGVGLGLGLAGSAFNVWAVLGLAVCVLLGVIDTGGTLVVGLGVVGLTVVSAVILSVEGGPEGVLTLTLIISLLAACNTGASGRFCTNFSATGWFFVDDAGT